MGMGAMGVVKPDVAVRLAGLSCAHGADEDGSGERSDGGGDGEGCGLEAKRRSRA